VPRKVIFSAERDRGRDEDMNSDSDPSLRTHYCLYKYFGSYMPVYSTLVNLDFYISASMITRSANASRKLQKRQNVKERASYSDSEPPEHEIDVEASGPFADFTDYK
jgi:hypothetical protein